LSATEVGSPLGDRGTDPKYSSAFLYLD
jgi:hypothetical protein